MISRITKKNRILRVLVSRDAGFNGSYLCKRLVRGGHQVLAIDILSNGGLENQTGMEENQQFTFYEFDVNNAMRLRGVFDKYPFDMVFQSCRQR